MNKRVMQDIKGGSSSTIKDNSTERKWDYSSKSNGIVRSHSNDDGDPSSNARNGGKTNGSKKWFGFIGLSLLVLILLFWGSTLFLSKAIISIETTQQSVTINDDFKALESDNTGQNLTFKVVSFPESEIIKVEATKEEEVTRKAKAVITVFNESDENISLVESTRFESSTGLIYRTTAKINVPGAKGESPGSLDVEVVADEAGELYNVGHTDMTIPGLMGNPLYDLMYARTKDPFDGGFEGVLRTASDEEVTDSVEAIRSDMLSRVKAKFYESLPDTQVSFPEAVYVESETEVPNDFVQDTDGSYYVPVKHSVLLNAVVFDTTDLSKSIALRGLTSYDGSDVLVTNFNELKFAVNNMDTFDPNASDLFEFSISGNPHIQWLLDKNDLRENLSGKDKSMFEPIVTQYSSIRRAELTIHPFWRQTFPSDNAQIFIEEMVF